VATRQTGRERERERERCKGGERLAGLLEKGIQGRECIEIVFVCPFHCEGQNIIFRDQACCEFIYKWVLRKEGKQFGKVFFLFVHIFFFFSSSHTTKENIYCSQNLVKLLYSTNSPPIYYTVAFCIETKSSNFM